ncbi:histidinol-phosphate transaminase [Flavobacteriaceae bacterium]|jgi:histidinol-phosphate aminotransferase|nr:histidinol-phosphate transaminase [Flavobacteriaceae bacterium]MDA7724255.1 histidinol-phosphate transaminase [Flavobacteriaceae bacterium]MDA7728237.1 histidinol-phosphate transaminase [Flavobacteriaceae bacterium]
MNLNKLLRKNILGMNPYSSARDEYKDIQNDMVFLDANENPFDSALNRYPDPQQTDLKTLISKQNNVAANQILLGNGSDEVLDLIFRAFCEPNQDSIVTLPPTYGMYDVLANLNAVENLQVPLSSDFQLEVDAILATIKAQTKLLFICSPNNPSGNTVDRIAIERLLNGFQGLVVIDEAYIDFTEKSSWLQSLNAYPNLIVTQTLSKAYGLAGIRLGICYASEEIIAVLNKIKPPYNINTLTQDAALKALQNKDIVSDQITTVLKERSRLIKAFKTYDFIKKIHPSEANFILIKVDDANKRYDELIKKGIVVRNRSSQLNCENCLRITVGTPSENAQLLTLLKTLK